MSAADQPRFVIKTTQGDKGPFSGQQLNELVRNGQLKPNVRVFDSLSGQSILVAQVLQQVGTGRFEAPAQITPSGSVPITATPPPASATPPPASATPPPASEPPPPLSEQQRTTAAFSKSDLGAEIANDLDLEGVGQVAGIGPGTPPPPGGTKTYGSQQPGTSGSRRATAGTSGRRQASTSGRRQAGHSGRRRAESDDEYDSDEYDSDEYDSDEFDSDEFEERPRGSRRKKKKLLLVAIISGGTVLLATIIVVALLLAPAKPYAAPHELPGYWHIDIEAMLTEKPPRPLDGFHFFEIAINAKEITFPGDRTYTFRTSITDNGTTMLLNCTSPVHPSLQCPTRFEKPPIGPKQFWFQYDGKWLILKQGQFPADKRYELGRVAAAVGASKFANLVGNIDELLAEVE